MAPEYCLYGFKPPFGRVPTSEVPYESEGPLARTFDGLNLLTDTAKTGGKPVAGLTFAQTWVWNLLGAYPVVSAPIGIGPAGVPMGTQIVANTFDDLDAYQLAAAYSRVAPALFVGDAFPDWRSQLI